MLRVFLVEDESTIRETLRDTVPWAQCGYEFAGEAGDGEMALPLIRQAKPDVLITDIRMPFMDGLARRSGRFPRKPENLQAVLAVLVRVCSRFVRRKARCRSRPPGAAVPFSPF